MRSPRPKSLQLTDVLVRLGAVRTVSVWLLVIVVCVVAANVSGAWGGKKLLFKVIEVAGGSLLLHRC